MSPSLHLGIEIGGTKLQLGVGSGRSPTLAEVVRMRVDPRGGAGEIRRQIEGAAALLIERHEVKSIGIGFGGPVDTRSGRAILSNQIEGWTNFPLVEWSERTLGRPTVLANDSDSAGLAEARLGAGQGHRVVFYNNVGSGIGGALILEGKLYSGGCGVAAEIGHLRPGLEALLPHQDLESMASGWGIAAAARARLSEVGAGNADAEDLGTRCQGHLERLDARILSDAAAAGNRLALEALDHACRGIGWALAQMITLLAPNVVVMGGGVSLVGEELFLKPLRCYVRRYVFPPLEDRFQIVAASLGEEVVVHGALALAAERHDAAL